MGAEKGGRREMLGLGIVGILGGSRLRVGGKEEI